MLVKIIVASTFLFFVQVNFSQNWVQLITTGNVPELKNHSSVYDPAANRMLVFGGRKANGSNSNELWSLNLGTNQWTQILPTGGPPSARFTQNAFFDSLNNRMIIWSGQGAELYNDVWAYNISTNSWQQLWPDGNVSGAPLKRYGTGGIFDPVSRNFITFAGFTTSGRFEDTWTFQTDSMKWTDHTNNPHPPKRCLHSACFAYDMGKMIIYGGQDTGPLDDIWSLDINNYSWQNLTPSFIPPGRFFYSMIYTGNGNIAVFGGLGGNPLGDMWKFSLNTNSWEQVSQGSTTPAARWGHTAIYIPQTDKMIIFGGEGAANYKDTWQFSNVSTIGIKQVSQNIPAGFALLQNYPNPFNPATEIKFNIPEEANVSLNVYDASGRQIAVLVNRLLKAGEYKVSWDASNFSSGVYFYKLNVRQAGSSTGEYSETKKMVLIK